MLVKRAYTLAVRSRKLSLAECPYVPHLAEKNIRKGFLKDSQYQALARETAKIGVWLRAMLECGFIYGWRKSELLHLKVNQLDLEGQTITLDPYDTKNDDPRIVFMTPRVFDLLRECVAGKDHTEFVFTRAEDRRGHRPRTPRVMDMRDAWAWACVQAGLGKVVCPTCLGEVGEAVKLKLPAPASDLADRRCRNRLG
jgi:integrase